MITFPRSFPTDDFTDCEFKLVRGDVINRTYRGQVQTMELADPYWTIKATTNFLDKVKRAQWQAWANSLKGSIKTFYAYDPEKTYPLAYGRAVLSLLRHGGGAFDGSATLTGSTFDTLSLSNLPDNYQFVEGDHISIAITGAKLSLHEVIEAVTGDASGVATVTVEPPIVGAPTLAAGAQLIKASCEMVMTPNTFSAPAAGSGLTQITFEGTQPLV